MFLITIVKSKRMLSLLCESFVSVIKYVTCHLYCSHENGSVKFWDVTCGSMRMIHELKTAILFVGQEPDANAMNEEFSDYNWPPYRKVSSYDPFEDDPRLAVKFVEFSPHSKTLCVGGSGGQVITFSLNSLPSEIHLEVSLLRWKVYVLHVYMCILYMYSLTLGSSIF